MHFKVRFIGKYYSFPLFCNPIFTFFSPLKPFLHHNGSQQLLLDGFSVFTRLLAALDCKPPSIVSRMR